MDEAPAINPLPVNADLSLGVGMMLWLLLPNLIWLVSSAQDPGTVLAMTGVSVCFFALPSLVFRTRRALFLANAPWALFVGVLVAFVVQYNASLTSGLMQSVFQTNWLETSEQLSRYSLPFGLSLLGFVGYVCAALRTSAAPLPGRAFLIALGLWSVIGFIYLPYLAFEAYHRFAKNIDIYFYRQSYPLNLIDTTVQAIGQTLAKDGRFGDTRQDVPQDLPKLVDGRKLFVLIIGESTRADGFDAVAKDTAFYSHAPDMVFYKNALAQSNFTDASVPMLLSGATTLEASRQRPALFAWQNRIGCKTAIASNNTIYSISNSATISDIAGDSGVTHLSRYDHDLLASLDGLLAAYPQHHLCIVLHMAGSHFDYAARYRKMFERYPVTGSEVDRLRASYWNSVVMVQDFIVQVRHRLARTNDEALLVYTSDHGENLLEIEGLREHVTTRPTEYELKVPMLFWSSPTFISRNEAKWQTLVSNQYLPVSNSQVLPTILDAMAIPDRYISANTSLMRPFVATERFFVHPDLSLRSEKTLLKNSHQP